MVHVGALVSGWVDFGCRFSLIDFCLRSVVAVCTCFELTLLLLLLHRLDLAVCGLLACVLSALIMLIPSSR